MLTVAVALWVGECLWRVLVRQGGGLCELLDQRVRWPPWVVVHGPQGCFAFGLVGLEGEEVGEYHRVRVTVDVLSYCDHLSVVVAPFTHLEIVSKELDVS